MRVKSLCAVSTPIGVYARHAGRAETVSRKDLRLARDIRGGRLLEQRREDAEAK